ncbi:hypothetical protein M407DRAFT_26299 [Tulasnella calospora MUT 4182]|uniref:F-box domain-containing protein n=1 Tax=Tulasnella calospora MUT 4182 TaxID=1051891 RepID=A0A0C3QFY9_9AGAM|nr:hypothetical protein M407DRAFT_26299 [Tulasnella calospora MUT 4182]
MSKLEFPFPFTDFDSYDDGDSALTMEASLSSVVDSRLRQIVVGTPDLWASFGISEAEMSFDHTRLCIQRSNTLPLKVQLYTYTLKQRSDLGQRFYDVLHPIASRIRILITYMTTYNGLKIVRSVLERLEMPTLEEIDLDYDSMFHGGPNRAIMIPGGGMTLRTLTLTGLFPIESNLSNLKSLTLGSAASWEWSIARIYTLVIASPALENLTFIGGESTFDVEYEYEVTELTLICPSLRSLAMKGGISANFTTIIFLALDAPNLETIHVTTPSISYETSLGVPVHWDQVIDHFEKRGAEGAIGRVRSLIIDPEDEGYSPRQNRAFFRFLMASLPWITSLELHRSEIGVLSICNEENDVYEKGLELLTTLTISGGPSPHALKRVLHFVCVRNGSSRGDLGEEVEEGGEVYSEDEDDSGDETDDYDDETEEDDDESENSASEVGDGAADGDEGVNNNTHESSEAAGGGSDVDGDEVYSDLTPIETLVIKGWTIGDAVGDGIIRSLKDEVQSLIIV